VIAYFEVFPSKEGASVYPPSSSTNKPTPFSYFFVSLELFAKVALEFLTAFSFKILFFLSNKSISFPS